MKKILLTIGVSFFLLFLGGMFIFFISSGLFYRKNQDEYFSKVSYTLKGEVLRYKFLGGARYMLIIDVYNKNFDKLELSSNEEFFGIFDRGHSKAYVVSYLGLPDVLETRRDGVPKEKVYIDINSKSRNIIFQTNNIRDTVVLRTTTIYGKDLIKIERGLNSSFRF